MSKQYTNEEAALIVLALLKAHGIRKVIASPGTTNMALVASMQSDSFFEMYSAVDERSGAYMACGLAAESGEPVVISCTGATASRNYMPGLTEAYYRKLPIAAITSMHGEARAGHHIAQVIDRTSLPKDVAKLSVALPIVKDADDKWECEIKVNRALLELRRHGGGPVHINLPTIYSKSYNTTKLPTVRVVNRISAGDVFPILPKGKIAIFIGAHRRMGTELTAAIDTFCDAHDAVVFCDHTSSYKGRYRLLYALAGGQLGGVPHDTQPDLFIHIGEVTGDYFGSKMCGKQVWRISPDGELRDTFRKLRYIFEMPEQIFFQHYSASSTNTSGRYLKICQEHLNELRQCIPPLPFSNVWLAQQMAHRIPESAVVHFGILNSLRAWNFFELPESVESACNVGGFGIDGCVSSLIGASLANPRKLYFAVVGDLASFYDLNVLGNRHVGKNVRILMVNNGKGTEFRQFSHPAALFGDDADKFIAAAGHFGNKSPDLVKHYAQDLGFEYLSASDKQQFAEVYEHFLCPSITDQPMLLEVFTESGDESTAFERICNIADIDMTTKAKNLARHMLGRDGINVAKKILGKE